MIINKAELAGVAVGPGQYPGGGLPEVAFVGRSNVGKSSLINSLLGRRLLARTSQHPGKTRTLNFYNVEDGLMFVDLPGYGYAKVSRSESGGWAAMIEGYLKKREQLSLIIMLVDIRHEPSASDIQMHEWLQHYNKATLVIATKADKLKRSQLPKHKAFIAKGLGIAQTGVLVFSSHTKQGRDELWGEILRNCQLKGLGKSEISGV